MSRNTFSMQPNAMKSLLEQLFQTHNREDGSYIETSTWAPLVDIKEDHNGFLVIADIPGVKKEDISITLENHVLTLKGERHSENANEKEGYTRIERPEGSFYRRFSLPQTADDDNISARYTQGVLEIRIPKKEKREKKIDIASDDL
ncbi:MAG: Hsp20/alpha crystallin family protein [Legionella sp.]|nr:Hsp20/alpha crystallin family protein [Legionella sp.]